jgi:hypothetical protein
VSSRRYRQPERRANASGGQIRMYKYRIAANPGEGIVKAPAIDQKEEVYAHPGRPFMDENAHL